MSEKIGIGIITCNREDFFKILIDSLPNVDEIVIVNDGKPYKDESFPDKINKIIQHKKNIGIGKSKNEALRYLIRKKCNHLFLLEDDIAIKDSNIFSKYIKASKVSGIFHFNYAFHGMENRNIDGTLKSRKKVTYSDDIEISFHQNTTAALSYFRDEVISKVGYLDEIYKNVLEHVDHTLQIIKAGYHPPFRWFADISDSHKYIQELDLKQIQSVNRVKPLSFKIRKKFFGFYFRFKNKISLHDIPDSSEEEVIQILDEIRKKNGE